MKEFTMEDLTTYCSQYGFIFRGSEIYGGLANTWDYGPLGTRLKNNIKDAWRYFLIQTRDNSYELDSDILMNPAVWEASGHLAGFSDPLVDCKSCRTRHRADNLINDYTNEVNADTMTQEEMLNFIRERQIPCPKCGKSDFTDIRQFNLMFATRRGVTEEGASTIYLRPENAQGEKYMVSYDDAGNIGKRYRRGDVIGTPYAITIDDNTLEKGTVTIRQRDTMEQIRLPYAELENYFYKRFRFDAGTVLL